MSVGTAERDLVAAAQAGDTAALDALLERYQGRVLRFTTKLCGDLDSAEEVAKMIGKDGND